MIVSVRHMLRPLCQLAAQPSNINVPVLCIHPSIMYSPLEVAMTVCGMGSRQPDLEAKPVTSAGMLCAWSLNCCLCLKFILLRLLTMCKNALVTASTGMTGESTFLLVMSLLLDSLVAGNRGLSPTATQFGQQQQAAQPAIHVFPEIPLHTYGTDHSRIFVIPEKWHFSVAPAERSEVSKPPCA